MTIVEVGAVRGERGEIYCPNYPIHLFSNKRTPNKRISNTEQGITIVEVGAVRGDGGEIYCSNYPIHLFSNKRISQ